MLRYADVEGLPVSSRFRVGFPDYIIGPQRKALWNCKYRLTSEDLRVIYDVAKTHDIAFGKAFYVSRSHPFVGVVVFECWHGEDTADRIDSRTSDTRAWQWRTLREDSDLDYAISTMRHRSEKVTRVPMIGLSCQNTAAPGWAIGPRAEWVGLGDTYGEAIEQTLFREGLKKLDTELRL